MSDSPENAIGPFGGNVSMQYDPPTPDPGVPSGHGPRPGPDPNDGDDGIHIAYVTRVDRPFGQLLLVVVSWYEGGEWVERTYELTDEPHTP